MACCKILSFPPKAVAIPDVFFRKAVYLTEKSRKIKIAMLFFRYLPGKVELLMP